MLELDGKESALGGGRGWIRIASSRFIEKGF